MQTGSHYLQFNTNIIRVWPKSKKPHLRAQISNGRGSVPNWVKTQFWAQMKGLWIGLKDMSIHRIQPPSKIIQVPGQFLLVGIKWVRQLQKYRGLLEKPGLTKNSVTFKNNSNWISRERGIEGRGVLFQLFDYNKSKTSNHSDL